MLISANFSDESGLKQNLDFIYARSKEGKGFHGLVEVMSNPVTITTAIHNIKSNKGAYTAGLDKKNINYYLQMPYEKLIGLVRKSIENYNPKPVKRIYISKSNGKMRPLGIPTILDRIVQECVRIVLEPIVEAKFYPHSYGFRPLRDCKDAITYIANIITVNKKDKPVYAIEGDIKGFFDNINHHKLLKTLQEIGVYDKRVLMIIKKMLKAGYFEGEIHRSELGTPQGGILSPLLANVYLNNFDWMIDRQYLASGGKDKRPKRSRLVLKTSGVVARYLVRYCDDWIILTQTEKEAIGLLESLKRYYKHKLKIELSEEKTKITNLTQDYAKFLGFLIKVAKPRPTPNKEYRNNLYPKIYPDHEKVKKRVSQICNEVRALRKCYNNTTKALQIERINSMIVGVMEYWKVSICSQTYKYIDKRVRTVAKNTFKKIYPRNYTRYIIPLNKTGNRLLRHKGYKAKTWAVKINGIWIGLTFASLTHSQRKRNAFNQNKSPYTKLGRKLLAVERDKPPPKDRPTIYTIDTLEHVAYKKTKYNFEYYMNREYAYNRDKGKCRVCGESLQAMNRHCHHVDNSLGMNKINKVSNLAWMHERCHRLIHSNTNYENQLSKKIISKINKFRLKLAK